MATSTIWTVATDTVPGLLHSPERTPKYAYVTTHAAEDLGLAALASHLQSEGLSVREAVKILSAPVCDPETLAYRQAVYRDFASNAGLRAVFSELLPRFDELSNFTSARKEASTPLQQTIWRLSELELLVECTEKLSGALKCDPKPQSEGLTHLSRYLDRLRRRNDYQSLKEQLPKLRTGLQYKRSVTLGVNLDDKLRPVEVAVLDINDRPFRESSLIGRLFGSQREFTVSSTVLSSPIPPELSAQNRSKIPLAPLFREIEQLLSGSLRPIQRALRAYIHENTEIFTELRRDAAFYLGAVALSNRLHEAGLPVTLPEVRQPGEDEHFGGLYNIHLPLRNPRKEQKQEKVVLNELTFASNRYFFILTGPNQGGKTTFTQAVGLAHLLGQSGLFIPAETGTIAPVDLIDSHFPTAEQGSLDTGRLSDEARRLSELVDGLTPHSLILLNESFASTSPQEAVTLASELLRVLSQIGVRGVFATHLHELAMRAAEFGSGVAPLTAEAIVNGESAERTYRVREGTPSGNSYARDIAVKHGLSYEQMRDRLRARGLDIS